MSSEPAEHRVREPSDVRVSVARYLEDARNASPLGILVRSPVGGFDYPVPWRACSRRRRQRLSTRREVSPAMAITTTGASSVGIPGASMSPKSSIQRRAPSGSVRTRTSWSVDAPPRRDHPPVRAHRSPRVTADVRPREKSALAVDLADRACPFSLDPSGLRSDHLQVEDATRRAGLLRSFGVRCVHDALRLHASERPGEDDQVEPSPARSPKLLGRLDCETRPCQTARRTVLCVPCSTASASGSRTRATCSASRARPFVSRPLAASHLRTRATLESRPGGGTQPDVRLPDQGSRSAS